MISVPENKILERGRIQAIDFIKGIDIIFMVLFNYSITLDFFGLIRIPSNYFYRAVFPISVAFIFIFLSGVTAHISYERHGGKITGKYFKRGIKLLFFAMIISLFTYVFVPQNMIMFGILHFFAFASFLMPFFMKYNKLNLIAGLSIITAGIYLQHLTFKFSYLFWLGFVPGDFSTFDYFPVIPWLGVILLGIYYSKDIAYKTSQIRIKKRFLYFFNLLGKHSLAVYLVHQPILILLLLSVGYKLF